MSEHVMTEAQAQREGRMRAIEIMETLLLCGREAETRRWVASSLDVAAIRRRLVDDKAAAPQASRPGAQTMSLASVESAFLSRGLVVSYPH